MRSGRCESDAAAGAGIALRAGCCGRGRKCIAGRMLRQVQALHCGLDAAAVSDSVLRAGQCVVTVHRGECLYFPVWEKIYGKD